jgi:S1-C subfamily serine protease
MTTVSLVIGLLLADPSGPNAIRVDSRLLEVEAQRAKTIANVRPSVVAIFAGGGAGGGSGVLISPDGYALSNYHVVRESGPAMKCGLVDGKLYDAVLVGTDPVGDVALIKLLGRDDFPAAALGDSDQLRLGQTVLVMGNPFLLASDYEPTVTMGIVSGLHRYQYPAGTILEYTDCIQTDASINPGNSGGPLFNLAGEVVGINGRASFEKRGRVNVGVGYSISINQVKNFLDHLRGGLIVDHATLGATVTTDSEGRVIVDEILTSSDAYRQGLRTGDELVTFAGRAIGSVNQFKNVLGIHPKGWRVDLVYRRDNRKSTLEGIRLRGVLREDDVAKASKAPPRPRQGPGPRQPAAAEAKIPDAVRSVYEAKAGFANYHFNRSLRESLLAGLRAKASFADRTGSWRIRLVGPDGGELELTLADAGVAWKAGQISFAWRAGDPDNLDPPGTGGLLVTLDHWRRMLVDQNKWFSACDYAGGFPAPNGDLCLALSAQRGGIESLWLFDRSTGLLRALECQVTDESAACELALDDYRPLAGHVFPHRWQVRHAGVTVGTYSVRTVELSP